MTKRNFYTVIFLCFAFIGQVFANGIYLPTVAYRETTGGEKQRFEYTYDNTGRVIFEEQYRWKDSQYVLYATIENEYFQLANGEFVQTKEVKRLHDFSDFPEYFYDRPIAISKESAYNANGLQLWEERKECYYDNPSEWQDGYRTEAVLNGQGVRTAIRSGSTGNMQIETRYTFDNKGRLISETYSDDDENWTSTYSWNDNDQLTGTTYQSTSEDGDYNEIIQNIQTVLNGEYFNPYALDFSLFGSRDYASEGVYWSIFPRQTPYAHEDYQSHEWFFNADANVLGMDFTIRTTVEQGGNKITTIIAAGEFIGLTSVFQKGIYGSWTQTEEGEDWENSKEKQYNVYGALIKSYEYAYGYDDDDDEYYEYHNGNVYNREYDSEGRPIKTTVFLTYHDGSEGEWYVETYDAWQINFGTNVNETNSQSSIAVYPNPATDKITVAGLQVGETVRLYDLSGNILFIGNAAQEAENISIGHLSAGIYFVGTNNGFSKVIKK